MTVEFEVIGTGGIGSFGNFLESVIERFNLDEWCVFIETGTYVGSSIRQASMYFDECHTIEVNEALYDKYRRDDGINYCLGDSLDVLPRILHDIDVDDCIVLYLDGHYSSGNTGRGRMDVPLLEELKLLSSEPNEMVIMIDDVYAFDGDGGGWEDINASSILNCLEQQRIGDHYIDGNRMIIHYRHYKWD